MTHGVMYRELFKSLLDTISRTSLLDTISRTSKSLEVT